MESLVTPLHADQMRRKSLAAASEDRDCVFVEMLYRDRWVTFDISAMEAKFLPLNVIVQRYFAQAFSDLQLPLADGPVPSVMAGSSSSPTPVV